MSFADMTPEQRQRKRESFILRFMMRRPAALYDIGVGPKTEWSVFRDAFPDIQTCGVEANPSMVEQIMKAGWKGPMINKAISSERGTLDLKIYRSDGLDASILDIQGRPVAETTTIETITLDDADDEFGNQADILLWMDIEGAELTALKSAPKLMGSGRVRWLNLEVRPDPPWEGGCTDAEIDELLTSLGYVKIAEYNKHTSSAHYDVIYFHENEPLNENPRPSHIPAA